MKVSFFTLGCKLNYAETSQLREQFEQAGHTIVEFGQPSDAVIINTCTVTENADGECRKIIRRALRISPDAFIGVTGCYAQLQPEEIASIDGVDAVFGTQEKMKIPELMPSFEKVDTPLIFASDFEEPEFQIAKSADTDSRTRAYLKLQDGCNYSCSFCTIPMARGKSRSMEFSSILRQINELEKAGFKEIILSGINLGDYSTQDGRTFTDIIRLIHTLDTDIRFRIGSVEPNLLHQDIISMIAESEVIVPHFHIPLQSGSVEMLRLMRRRYKAAYYADLVHRIKDLMPDACIGADVIVGFPGETNQHFTENYRFIEALPVSYLHVFTYSERENTPAAQFPGKVSMQERKSRNAQLRELSLQKKSAFYQSQAGKTQRVIPETYHQETGRWSGWTDNYIRAEFMAPPSMLQQAVMVELQSFDSETELMQAKMLHSVDQASSINATYIPILL
jgi:threonylcarbamoyladenosine tRNA methylthiotransferase MtaB